jgi:hypothetical protein
MRIFLTLGVLAALVLAAVAAAGNPLPQTSPGDPLDPRTYEPASKPFLAAHATGVQKYACQANGTWLFTDPEATLFKLPGARTPIATHFLNVFSGRPVWQFKDGSAVEAARTASASAGAANIPWLLLRAAANIPGRLGNATWVQRLNTSGGVAPAGACTPGATVAVPYTADYVFWKASFGSDE